MVPRSKWLAKLSDPWVRLVDPLIGEAVGMRVDVDLEDGTTAAGVFVHKKLSDSVGYSPAASLTEQAEAHQCLHEQAQAPASRVERPLWNLFMP